MRFSQPLAVVEARSTEEVSRAMRLCREAGVTVVPFGGGSGVCGAIQVPEGAVVISTAKLQRPGGPRFRESAGDLPSRDQRNGSREASPRGRTHHRPLAPVHRRLHRRRLGRHPRRRPVLLGLWEHRGPGDGPGGGPSRRRRPANPPHAPGVQRPRPAPALPGKRGHTRDRHRGDLLPASASRGRAAGRPSTSRAWPPASSRSDA